MRVAWWWVAFASASGGKHATDVKSPGYLKMKRQAETAYFAPYKNYGRPTHLLTDVEWGNFERRSRKPRACALPDDIDGVDFYLFAFVREDSPAFLAHFLRWYGAAGLDLAKRARHCGEGHIQIRLREPASDHC